MDNLACKVRIHPTKEQEKFLRSNIGACRFVWNMLVDLQELCYDATGEILSEFDCNYYVTSLKNTRRFLLDTDSRSLCLVSKHLAFAFKSFFKSLNSGPKRGLPRKKNRFARKSYTTDSNTVRIEGKRIVLPKIGAVRCDWKRLPGVSKIHKINSATISLDGNRFYVSLQYKTSVDLSWQKTGMAVGIDLGIKTLVTCSDGKTYENTHELKKAEKRLKHAQRAVDRRKNARKKNKTGCEESRRLQRARLKLQRRHAKIRNRRKDRIEYITSKILHANDVVCMEDLNTKGMTKNHHLAKAVSDASFGMIRQIFVRKAQTRGKKIVFVGRRFPSSQICSICGARTGATKNLAIRSWICPSCGIVHDRDFNASMNILTEGMRILDMETDAGSEWFRQCTAAQARRRNVRGGHTEVPEALGISPFDEAHSSAQGNNTLRQQSLIDKKKNESIGKISNSPCDMLNDVFSDMMTLHLSNESAQIAEEACEEALRRIDKEDFGDVDELVDYVAELAEDEYERMMDGEFESSFFLIQDKAKDKVIDETYKAGKDSRLVEKELDRCMVQGRREIESSWRDYIVGEDLYEVARKLIER